MRTCSTECRTASTACPRPWACGDRPPNTPLKAWMGATHFLTRTLDKVRTEMSLHVLAYNLQANDHDLRRGTADGGDQNLIASLKPHAPVGRPTPPPSPPRNASPSSTSYDAFFHGLGHNRKHLTATRSFR